MAAGVSTSLEVYENQEGACVCVVPPVLDWMEPPPCEPTLRESLVHCADRFNELCLDVLGLLGPAGAESVPVLMKMLRDLQESHHHEVFLLIPFSLILSLPLLQCPYSCARSHTLLLCVFVCSFTLPLALSMVSPPGIPQKLVKTLFLLGDYGIQALVEGASEAYTEWDSFIL